MKRLTELTEEEMKIFQSENKKMRNKLKKIARWFKKESEQKYLLFNGNFKRSLRLPITPLRISISETRLDD